jgi:hypothetical protein
MSENNYAKHQYQEDTFNLGLTMAGAVSAGAYTGGVLDYLFEVLDKWEKAKNGDLIIDGFNKEDIPKHKVSIDVMGGTSAGGMTTIMAALYAIKGRVNPVTSDEANSIGGDKNNLFYNTWVNLDDDIKNLTFDKALMTDDLKESGKIDSLLNSHFIDNIAKTAFSVEGDPETNPTAKLPGYISRDLEMLISHTMLKGIPLTVDFSHSSGSTLSDNPSHSSYEHFLFSHFRLNEGNPVDPDHYIWLNPFQAQAKEHLKKAAIATGAFPVGLRYREFDKKDFNPEYLKNVLSRIIEMDHGNPEPAIKSKIQWDQQLLNNYRSVTVDGGALNNEPYAEGLCILKKRYGDACIEESDKEYQKYGMVMIDPFPDFAHLKGSGKYPKDLMGVAPGIIGTLWDQAKIKRNEIKLQFENKAYRGVIFPVKYTQNKQKYQNPLACGAMEAFSGFLDRKFRHHDFFLGRNNARNFIRAYLSVPYDPANNVIHPLHRDKYWTKAMRNRLKIELKDKNGRVKTYLPLIPDMNLLIDNRANDEDIYKYDVPDIPQIPKSKIKQLEDKVYLRSSAMLSQLLELPYETERKKPGFLGRVLGKIVEWFDQAIRKKLRSYGANWASAKVIKWFTKELENAGLLEGSEQGSG